MFAQTTAGEKRGRVRVPEKGCCSLFLVYTGSLFSFARAVGCRLYFIPRVALGIFRELRLLQSTLCLRYCNVVIGTAFYVWFVCAYIHIDRH